MRFKMNRRDWKISRGLKIDCGEITLHTEEMARKIPCLDLRQGHTSAMDSSRQLPSFALRLQKRRERRGFPIAGVPRTGHPPRSFRSCGFAFDRSTRAPPLRESFAMECDRSRRYDMPTVEDERERFVSRPGHTQVRRADRLLATVSRPFSFREPARIRAFLAAARRVVIALAPYDEMQRSKPRIERPGWGSGGNGNFFKTDDGAGASGSNRVVGTEERGNCPLCT